jgi:hypothetical protein
MSNELTPQEKYPKFYKDPHLWIDAIEVSRVDRVIVQVLTVSLLYNAAIKDYKPLFKPQEGEAFIKDLEQAVSAGVGTQARRIIKSPKNIIAFDAEHQFYQCIMIIENDIKKVTSMLTDFDTAAYVDSLRKLGYYL